MKVFVAKDAGYCFGVRDAVNLAYKTADKYGNVYMLGDIVHNENVVKNLKNAVDRKHFYNFETSVHVKENIKIYNEMKTKRDIVTVPNTDYVQSHFEFCAQQGLRKSINDAHPSKEGHHQWANILYNFISAQNIL